MAEQFPSDVCTKSYNELKDLPTQLRITFMQREEENHVDNLNHEEIKKRKLFSCNTCEKTFTTSHRFENAFQKHS